MQESPSSPLKTVLGSLGGGSQQAQVTNKVTTDRHTDTVPYRIEDVPFR